MCAVSRSHSGVTCQRLAESEPTATLTWRYFSHRKQCWVPVRSSHAAQPARGASCLCKTHKPFTRAACPMQKQNTCCACDAMLAFQWTA